MTTHLHRLAGRGCLLLLLLSPAPVRADSQDLNLDELLNLELRAMRLTDIHHTHEVGEWMIGFRSMFMHMEENRNGTTRLSNSDVLNNYMITPTEMDMQMHMLGIMYGASDRLTLMMMLPYMRITMDHVNRMGVRFTTQTEGPGDVKLSALYSLVSGEQDRLIADLGVSVPTGSIEKKDDTPMGHVRLPYPMQLGSGTLDARPGLTYIGQSEGWHWGGRAGAVVRLGDNDNDYRLGNRARISTWLARRLASFVSVSGRLMGQAWADIHGADRRLNANMVPTADPELRAGRRLDVLLGANFFFPDGPLYGNRVTIEAGLPVYQSLDGPQLETDWTLSLSWNWTF